MTEETYLDYLKRNNFIYGILFSSLITAILYLLLYTIFIGLFFLADIHFILGSIVGLNFMFKNRKESQSYIKTGVIAGLSAALISLLIISILDWFIYSVSINVFNFILLFLYIASYFIVTGLLYILTGIIMGYIFGSRARRKDSIDTRSPLL